MTGRERAVKANERKMKRESGKGKWKQPHHFGGDLQLSIQTHPRFALICFHYFAFPSISFPFFPCSFPCISFHLLPLFIHVHCIFLSLFFSFPSNSFHFLNFPAVMCSCSFIVLSLFVHFLSLFFIPFHILPFLFNSFQLLVFPFTFCNSGSPNKF